MGYSVITSSLVMSVWSSGKQPIRTQVDANEFVMHRAAGR